MRNLLRLHEAIVIILLYEPKKTATFKTIAREIEKRNLFPKRKGSITLEEQIKLRTSILSSKYRHWFKFKKPDILKMRLKTHNR